MMVFMTRLSNHRLTRIISRHIYMSTFRIYQWESGFNMNCIPFWSVVRILKEGLHIIDALWCQWKGFAVMHCLIEFHISEILLRQFLTIDLWCLGTIFILHNPIHLGEDNFSLYWQHVMLVSFYVSFSSIATHMKGWSTPL